MENQKKPYLGGIQEFGAAAYVKDLSAGKLDARAKKGRFVGYDSESKGYRIYWRSSDDTATIPGVTQSEGEKDKIIQAPQNAAENPTEPDIAKEPVTQFYPFSQNK